MPHTEASDGAGLVRSQAGLLEIASAAGSLEYVMRAVHELHIPAWSSQIPMLRALCEGRIEVTSMLFKLQSSADRFRDGNEARIAGNTSLVFAEHDNLATLQYLLLRGEGLSPWSPSWFVWEILCQDLLCFGDVWRFQELEGLLFHALLHDGAILSNICGGFALDRTPSFRGGSPFTTRNANLVDAARLWSLWRNPNKYRFANRDTTVHGFLCGGHSRAHSKAEIQWFARGLVRRLTPRQRKVYLQYQYMEDDDFVEAGCKSRPVTHPSDALFNLLRPNSSNYDSKFARQSRYLWVTNNG